MNTTSHFTHGHCKVSLTPFCVKRMKCDKMMEHGQLWSEKMIQMQLLHEYHLNVMRYCTGN